MRGLVLSGGGANGAYEVGVLKHLVVDLGVDFDVLTGTSVGALNAGCLVQFDDLREGVSELEKLWLSLRGSRDIYKPWVPLLGLLGGFWHTSWYSTAPLAAVVAKYFDGAKVTASKRKLIVGACSHKTGQLRRWTNTSPQLDKALLASSAFPAFFTPVEIDGELWTDAGLREIVPVEDAINAGATSLVVVTTCPSEHMEPLSARPRAVELSKRCIDIMSNEVVAGDLARCHEAGLKVLSIAPSVGLGDSLDFSPAKTRALIERGYNEAKALGVQQS